MGPAWRVGRKAKSKLTGSAAGSKMAPGVTVFLVFGTSVLSLPGLKLESTDTSSVSGECLDPVASPRCPFDEEARCRSHRDLLAQQNQSRIDAAFKSPLGRGHCFDRVGSPDSPWQVRECLCWEGRWESLVSLSVCAIASQADAIQYPRCRSRSSGCTLRRLLVLVSQQAWVCRCREG